MIGGLQTVTLNLKINLYFFMVGTFTFRPGL